MAGESTNLECVAKNANPEADIRWIGAEEVSRVVNVTRLVVKPTWKYNGAKITCQGSNPYYGVSKSGVVEYKTDRRRISGGRERRAAVQL